MEGSVRTMIETQRAMFGISLGVVAQKGSMSCPICNESTYQLPHLFSVCATPIPTLETKEQENLPHHPKDSPNSQPRSPKFCPSH